MKTSILKYILCLAAVPAAGRAFAAPSACENLIARMAGYERDFLDPKSSTKKTEFEVIEKTFGTSLDAFSEISKKDPCRVKAWIGLVKLAIASAVYDESALAVEALADRVSPHSGAADLYDSSLVKPYNATLDGYPTEYKCRVDYLRYIIAQNICIEKSGSKGTPACIAQNGDKTNPTNCIEQKFWPK